jgi:hypothetical protein
MKILLGDFNAKLGKEGIFKPTIGNNNLLQERSDKSVRIVNLFTSRNLVVKSTMFQHQNSRTFTWTSPDGKTHNLTYHILIDRRWHSHIFDVPPSRRAHCDIDHYLVFAKVREKLVVSKQEARKFDVEKFNLRGLHELEVTKQHHVMISNRFPALENLNVVSAQIGPRKTQKI